MSFYTTVPVDTMEPIDLSIARIKRASEQHCQGGKPVVIKFMALIGYSLAHENGKPRPIVAPVGLKVTNHTKWESDKRLGFRFYGLIGSTLAVLDCECSPNGGGTPVFNIPELPADPLEIGRAHV